jgi:hypothetical protein
VATSIGARTADRDSPFTLRALPLEDIGSAGSVGTVSTVTIAALYPAVAAFHDQLGALSADLRTSGLLGVSLGGVE